MTSSSHFTGASEVIGLVDGHSFYVSCHQLFEPKLQGMPVVVLGNNDSCVVARSDQAKALGVKMSQPAFELRDLVVRQGLILRSSNYALYHDISRRMMLAVQAIVPEFEPASVDECFVRLTGMQGDFEDIGRRIQSSVMKLVGIPTGVGISRNRTTAKLASWASKRWKAKTGSVVCLLDSERLEKLLRYADAGEVWGIGSRLKEKLAQLGICTAWDLAQADAAFIRGKLGVTVQRTAMELSGHYCFQFGEIAGPRQMISSTRSFGTPVTELSQIQTAISTFAARVGEKLRSDGSLAVQLGVLLQEKTPPGQPRQQPSFGTSVLLKPTNDTRELIAIGQEMAIKRYYVNRSWVKAGVVCLQTVPADNFTPDLFTPQSHQKSAAVMRAIDYINNKAGGRVVRFGRESQDVFYGMKALHQSPHSTTRWDEIPEVD